MGAVLQLGYVHFFGDMIGIGPSVQTRIFLFSEVVCTQGAGTDCGRYDSGVGGSFGGSVSSFSYRQTYRTFDISLLLDVFSKFDLLA